jgi:predicted MFS family arabinose efflux permease
MEISTALPPNKNKSYRWVVLGVFALVAGISQMLWLNFAPILVLVQKTYGLSELAASQLILIFPLLYVVLSIPAGALTDRRGYRYATGLGAVIMAVFSLLRIFDGSFITLLVAQIGIAAAQPFVVNGVSKLVGDWFEPEHGAIATGLATVGMFAGMALAMGATPPLVARFGMSGAMAVFAAITVAGAVAFLGFAKPGPYGGMQTAGEGTVQWRRLLTDRNLVLLYGIAFLGLGFFNGLTTWLEGILLPNGIDSEQAGMVGAALIVGGIVGAAVIPAISDAIRRRKPLLIACSLIAAVALFPLCTGRDYTVLLVVGALTGFFFLPAFALLLEMCAELSGEEQAGAATGFLMMAGNAGGVAVSVAMVLVKGDEPTFIRAVWLLLGVLLAAALPAFWVPETFGGAARNDNPRR